MKQYKVFRFGVNLQYKAGKHLTWQGMAESSDDAIDKALNENWNTEADKDWVKPFLSARLA